MNILDIILAIPLCYFIYKGWRRGLIFELAALIGIVAGCWAAIHFSTWVAELLKLEGDGALLIAFFITFMGVIVGSYFLGKAIEGIIKMVKANALNKILGALMGMLKCLCVLSILLNFVLLVDYNHIIITPKVQQESKLFKPTYTLGNKLTASLKLQLQHLREKNNNESSKN
ncbi:MAG: CvpA family protein [Bacteroidales bacterium]|nr:CvpA family protein [Bacteroidales bacterium]